MGMRSCLKRNKIVVMVICVFLVLPSLFLMPPLFADSVCLDDDSVKNSVDWTVLYYVCGDNPRIDPFVDPLLENLTRIGSTESVHLIALVDRFGENNTNVWYVTSDDGLVSLNEELDFPCEVDMSQGETLVSFYGKCTTRFPSEYVALITYADGGTGWQKYMLNDVDGSEFLSLPSFAACLRQMTQNGSHKIDLLQTSCCMSNIELGIECAPFVEYLLSTQEHISLKYWVPRFYQYVWDLCNQSRMTPVDVGLAAAERLHPFVFQMHESYGVHLFGIAKVLDQLPFPNLHLVMMKSSVCLLDLSVLSELVSCVDDFSNVLLKYLKNNDNTVSLAVKNARKDAREYGKANPTFLAPPDLYYRLPIELLSYHCRIDLFHFIYLLKDLLPVDSEYDDLRSCCMNVMTGVNQSVVVIKKVEDDSSFGLNIYFPKQFMQYNKDIKNGVKNYPLDCPYEALVFSKLSSWDEFLKSYLKT